MNGKRERGSLWKVVVLCLAVILLTLAIDHTTILRNVEAVTRDIRFRLRHTVSSAPGISLVLVDPATVGRYGYPVPYRYYAVVASKICKSGAKAVAVDRVFESQDPADRSGNAILNQVLTQNRNIVLPWYGPIVEDPLLSDSTIVPSRFAMHHRVEDIEIVPHKTSLHQEEAVLPYYEALQNAKWLGNITAAQDSAQTDRIEKVPLLVAHGGRVYPSLSLIVACLALDVDPYGLRIEDRSITIPVGNGTISIPIDHRGQIMVNYLDGESIFLRDTFSMSSIYESIISGYPIAELGSFEDKAVFIGNSGVIGTDAFSTPFGRSVPNVVIHAMIVNSILQRKFITAVPWYINLIALALSVFVISLIQGYLSPRAGFLCFSAMMITIVVFALALFQFGGAMINVSRPMSGVLFAFLGVTFRNYAIEFRRARYIRQLFGKHVSEEIMSEVVLGRNGEIPMAEHDVTVLFADMCSHSKLAQVLDSSEFSRELNDYLNAMLEAILENGGVVNRFLGDGLLALYNVPILQHDHVLRAVRTGLAVQQHVAELNQERARRGREPVYVRIGVNTGRAMAGTVGSEHRLEYSVIGDAVNIGKRAEQGCEPGKVAVTEAVVQKLGSSVDLERAGIVSIEKKAEELMLYQVLAVRDENSNAGMAGVL